MAQQKRKRVVMARLVPRAQAGDEFDLAFWRKVGVAGRFDANRAKARYLGQFCIA